MTSADGPSPEAFRESLTLMGEADEFLPAEIQRDEKMLLGSYVSSHPLDDVVERLPLLATATAKELSELSDGSPVVMAGLITETIIKTTKTNKRLCIGQLEDLTGSTEFVAFQETLDQLGPLLEAGQKVVLCGKLQLRGDDTYSIVVQTLRPLDTVQVLQLRFKQPPRYEEVAHLRDVFRKVKGEDPVVLVWGDRSRMLVGPSFWVNHVAACQALEPLIANGLGQIIEKLPSEPSVN
jgi:DNA polymerase-3 subunit alpha